jgi:hypothetical protein
MTMNAAKEVNGIGHIASGMPADPFQKGGEMEMARGPFAGDPRQLGRGNAEGHWID